MSTPPAGLIHGGDGTERSPFLVNLCSPARVLTSDLAGRQFRFTCGVKADNKTTWACTGSEHYAGYVVRCTCACHKST